MSKIGRNETCLCGSNKKYKKCCLFKEQFVGQVQQNKLHVWMDDQDHLTRDTNRVVDLINEGKLDEAEEGAKKLLADYPEVEDGFDRLGMVYEKRGDYARAVEMFQKALDFILDQEESEHWGKDFYRTKISTLAAQAVNQVS